MAKELRRRLYAWTYAWLGLIDFTVCIITLTLLGTKISDRFLNWAYLKEIKKEIERQLGEGIDVEFAETEDEEEPDGKDSPVEGCCGNSKEGCCNKV